MKIPTRFWTHDDCGCSPSYGVSHPVVAPTGARVCDDKYFGLMSSTDGQLLVIPPGSNCQAYLKGADGIRGFITYENGTVRIDAAPRINMPVINPPVSGNTPATGGFKYLLVGSGADPTNWQMLSAPTDGEFQVIAKGGAFGFVDAGQIPGINTVGASAANTTKGNLLVVVESAPDEFTVRKLSVIHGRLIVGDVDSEGVAGYKVLPSTDFLEHPKARFEEVHAQQFVQLDDDNNPIIGGIPELPVEGVGAITDAVLAVYSPTQKLFYRAPDRTKERVASSADVQVPDNGAWQAMNGHCTIDDVQFNYPDFMVSATVRSSIDNNSGNAADYNMDFGLFIDGALDYTWLIKGAKDNSMHRMVKGLAIGNHTVEIRVRKTAVAQQTLHILESNMDVFTIL
jgi:hypothetical protein